jgi:hypothetical protein
MYVAAHFYGSINGTVLTETKPIVGVSAGTIAIGNTIIGKGVPDNTIVTSLGPADAHGNSTYNLNIPAPSNGVPSEPMQAISYDIPASQLSAFSSILIVPLLTTPSQTLSVELNDQNTNINVYQRSTGLYVDVGINAGLIIAGVLALDRNRIVRDGYLGFTGDLAFWDSQGTKDPDWTGLNTRYYLGYFLTT